MGWARWQTILFPDKRPCRAPWHELMDPALPLVEVGPGDGATLVQLARAFPEASVIGVEPDPEYLDLAQREVEAAGVADRVALQPCTIAEAALPGRLGGVVAQGVLYFLSPGERTAFWQLMADRVAPGACVVTEGGGHGPGAHEDAEPRLLQEPVIQGVRWERWFAKRALPDGRVEITNTMRSFRGDELLSEEQSVGHCWAGEDRRAEIAATGAFEVTEAERSDEVDALLIARRR